MYILDEPWSALTAVRGKSGNEDVVAILDPEDKAIAFLNKKVALNLASSIIAVLRATEENSS